MLGSFRIAVVLILLARLTGSAHAQPEGFVGVVAGEKPTLLHVATRSPAQPTPLPKKSKLVPLDDLQFTGPRPSHPFVLGNFAADGHWGLVNGSVQMVDGKNAALQLAWADQFELEGVIEQSGYGGWFFLVGWDEGRGYAVHSVSLKESGSPWFISEFRGSKAIADRTREFEKFEWKGEQPFKLTVQESTFSLDVGRFHVFAREPLEGYTPGMVVIGAYDTNYGPKPLRIRSLKIRSLTLAPADQQN